MIIGFTGKMGVGKSTAIDLLMGKTGDYVKLVKFAQPLYDMQGYIYDRISSVHKPDSSFTKDRKLLQWLGTDWGRDSISPSLWVSIWMSEVDRLAGKFKDIIIVCDDVRFDNEASALKNMGGSIIKIESNRSPDRINTKSGITNHASEAGISNKYVDFIVENDDTMEEFKERLNYCYKELGVK